MKLLRTILSVILFVGCNSVKQVLKSKADFEKIGQAWEKEHPCVNDSVTTFLPGRVDSVYIPVLPIDTGKVEQEGENLAKKLAAKYENDHADCERQVKEAYATAYLQGAYMARQIKIPKQAPDTIIKKFEDVRRVNVLNQQVTQLTSDKIFYQNKADHFLQKVQETYIIIGGLVLLLGFFIYLKVRR